MLTVTNLGLKIKLKNVADFALTTEILCTHYTLSHASQLET